MRCVPGHCVRARVCTRCSNAPVVAFVPSQTRFLNGIVGGRAALCEFVQRNRLSASIKQLGDAVVRAAESLSTAAPSAVVEWLRAVAMLTGFLGVELNVDEVVTVVASCTMLAPSPVYAGGRARVACAWA